MGVLHVRISGFSVMHLICCGSGIVLGNKKEGEGDISLELP